MSVFFLGLILGVVLDMTVAMSVIWWHLSNGWWQINPTRDKKDYPPAKFLGRMGFHIGDD